MKVTLDSQFSDSLNQEGLMVGELNRRFYDPDLICKNTCGNNPVNTVRWVPMKNSWGSIGTHRMKNWASTPMGSFRMNEETNRNPWGSQTDLKEYSRLPEGP